MPIVKKDVYYVTTQFLLMIMYVIPVNLGYFRNFWLVGWTAVLLGCALGVAALWQLRQSISPFPSPKATANLIEGGVFRWVRHPIYTGILAVTFGYALVTGSTWKSIIALALCLLFQFKARYEERLLQKSFDRYGTYMTKTGRFLPKVRR